jgi:hypothetical protein
LASLGLDFEDLRSHILMNPELSSLKLVCATIQCEKIHRKVVIVKQEYLILVHIRRSCCRKIWILEPLIMVNINHYMIINLTKGNKLIWSVNTIITWSSYGFLLAFASRNQA